MATERDMKNYVSYAHEKDKEEGKAEGLAEGKAEGLAEGEAIWEVKGIYKIARTIPIRTDLKGIVF